MCIIRPDTISKQSFQDSFKTDDNSDGFNKKKDPLNTFFFMDQEGDKKKRNIILEKK